MEIRRRRTISAHYTRTHCNADCSRSLIAIRMAKMYNRKCALQCPNTRSAAGTFLSKNKINATCSWPICARARVPYRRLKISGEILPERYVTHKRNKTDLRRRRRHRRRRCLQSEEEKKIHGGKKSLK